MTSTNEEFDSFKDYVNSIKKDWLFSKVKITVGDIIIISVIVIFIIAMLMSYFNCQCMLDCSMCPNCEDTLSQKGIGNTFPWNR